jgi:hypothetical protein
MYCDLVQTSPSVLNLENKQCRRRETLVSARVQRAEAGGEPPLVAEGDCVRPWRAEGDGAHPRRRATTTEGWGD